MRDWRLLDKVAIFTGKDKNGNRYLTSFLKDYKRIFHPLDINAGCERCLNDYYNKILNYLTMAPKENKNTDFILKIKYNGIPLKFGSRILVTNANLTDEIGSFLLANHPRGEKLFDKIGKIVEDEPKKDEDLKLKDLRIKYPEISAGSKAKFLIKLEEFNKETEEKETEEAGE